jgi:hypothetical protein
MLALAYQTDVTSITVLGLEKLQNLYMPHTGVTVLDASDLPMLDGVYATGASLVSADVSNTPVLTVAKFKENYNLASIDLSSSSVQQLALRGAAMSSLDVSGSPTLTNIGLNDEAKIKNLNASNCPNLVRIAARRNEYLENVNISNCPSLNEIKFPRTTNMDIINLTGSPNLTILKAKFSTMKYLPGGASQVALVKLRAQFNKLKLDVVAPMYNVPGLTDRNASDQTPYADTTIDIADPIDYSDQATININGTPTASNFDYYDIANTLLGSNATGIYTFPSVGDYYVIMSNSGVSITTGTITVVDVATLPVISATLTNDFGTTSVGTSVSNTLTITNTGGSTLTISSIVMPAGFTYTGSVTTIAPSASATLTVTFSPVTTTTYGGSVLIISDAASGSGVLSVTGVGIPAPPSISATLISDFGSVLIGSDSSSTLTITNTGGTTLTISSITLPSGYTLTGSVTTIAPSASATLTVTFTPVSAITYSGSVQIISDAASGSGTLSVTGVGLPVTGILSTQEQSSLSFYPNPTQDYLYIKAKSAKEGTLYIYSVEGVLLKEAELGVDLYIDIRDLPNGLYIVRSADNKLVEQFVKY